MIQLVQLITLLVTTKHFSPYTCVQNNVIDDLFVCSVQCLQSSMISKSYNIVGKELEVVTVL